MHGWSRQHLLSNLPSNNISDPLGRNGARAGEKTKRKWRKTRHELYSSRNTREWSETYTVSCHKYWRQLQDTNNCLLCSWLLHPRLCQRYRMAIVRANPQLWYKKNISPSQFYYVVPRSRVIMHKLIVTQRLNSPLFENRDSIHVSFATYLETDQSSAHFHTAVSPGLVLIVLRFSPSSPTLHLEISWLKLAKSF